ncbi:MAG: ribonuclease HII [Candidatus Methanomethylicia archaeon]
MKTSRKISGVDDAGRGPVIGPLIIAGVLIEEEKLGKLTEIGVKDSKKLTSRQRVIMAEKIKNIALDYTIEEIYPKEIDEVVLKAQKYRRLNYLEAEVMGKVINRLKPDIVYVDASDINEERFKENIMKTLTINVEIISKHHADAMYPICSAASILAKVRRDEIINELKGRYGEFGSGYVTDPKTIQFITNWIKEYGQVPDIVRRSWKTVRKILG